MAEGGDNSSSHSSLLSCALDSPKVCSCRPAPLSSAPQRRCSARLLSQSVHQTLKQLQREEHESRVAELVRKNRIFYRKQRICESFTAFAIIVSFSGYFS